MKTRQKGNRARRKAIESITASGYLVDVVEKTGKFVKVKDLFGLFDLIAIKPDQVVFIQVTCNKPHSHTKYKEFAIKYPTFQIAQYVWIDRKGFKIFAYDKDGDICNIMEKDRLI